MQRTRGSLYYPAAYLYFGGAGFLILPPMMLAIFFAEGIYSMVTLRLLGAVMLALGMVLSGIIEQSIVGLYRHMIRAQVPVLLALAYVYFDSLDRMWAILFVIVLAGWVGSVICYRLEMRAAPSA